MGTFAGLVDTIREFLNTRVATQAVRSSNIANLDTPNYKAKVPQFSATLRSAVERADQPQQTPWQMQLRISDSTLSPREDGNNVNLEKEMAAIAENNMEFSAGVKMLSKHLALMRYATGGGA